MSASSFGSSSTAAATHLQVIVPEHAESGTSFDVIVYAETASNRIASGYTGTVDLSLSPTDTGATLPADYTFTAKDHGVHVFHVTLSATGSEQIIATDTGTTTITGSATTTVDPAPVATQLIVSISHNVMAGSATSVTVTALDASGHKVTNYTGTVTFSSTDSTMTTANGDLPASYTFTAADAGKHTFQVTFPTPTSTLATTLSVSDGNLTGSVTPTVNAVGVATHFALITLGSIAGFPAPVEVVALDAHNHIVTNYTGTVHFTNSDSGATLPSDYTFTAGDDGMHLFSVTFATAGKQMLTATDTMTSTLTGQTNVFVLSQLTFGKNRR
ncbi:MAG TPA: hypothetical protein VHR72_02115 [Gemmataceae bacterium]|nr:hypothetical protein [Gemmataceae bacterium]